MKSAKALLDAGQLGAAIQELNGLVKTRPADPQLRVFLFEALCFAGSFDRAARQLEVLSTQATDAGTALALQVYQDLVAAESARQQVFAGTGLPKFLVPPPPAVEQYVVLLRRLAEGSPDVADQYAAAEEATAALSGTADGEPFDHFRDADDRLAPVLEAVHGSSYLWLPFEQIRRIEIAPPKRLRDLIWASAKVEMTGHPPGEIFIPALYVNSHAHEQDAVKLGRLTEWEAVAEQIVVGRGQRAFLAGETERAMLDLRVVEFAPRAGGVA